MKSRSTLATWLGSLAGSRLARVLETRRDAAATPEPRSIGELADRLQRPGSVALALPRLALPHLQAAEALAALRAPASRDALAKLLGAADDDTIHELEAVLEALADHALVWPDGAGKLRMAGPLRKAWDAPLGLDAQLEELLVGSTSDELRGMLAALGVKPPSSKSQRLAALVEHHSDPERILSVVAEAPAATRKLLEGRAGAGPARPARFVMFGSPGPDPEPGARWALERGLLVQDRHRYGPARMAAEVALALRGPGWHAPFQPVPPSVGLAPVAPKDVDHEASAAASAFTAGATSVLSACSATAPARLKSGGIGARELARIGKAAQADDAVVRLTLEVAYAAGLLARDGDRVAPTEAYDAWAAQEPPEQFAVLLQAWRNLPLTPTQARDEDDKALPALAAAPPCNGCVQARHGLLAAAERLPAGQGVQGASDLGLLIAWYRPFADSSPDGAPFAAVIREAELLGVLARGALSAIGIHLRTGDTERLGIECRRLLPSATATARIGADLTAVVTGTPSTQLASLLESVADRETSGTASVWRFSAGSIRRALDAGRTPEDITADLEAVATGPLPQPLSYLIADTARAHGRVRVALAACVLHGDEPALLAELAAHRRLARLGLRQLAPTVLISRSPLDTTLAALRAEGYAPVAETAEGTVRIEKAQPRRAAAAVPAPRGSGARGGGRTAATSTAKESATLDPSTLATRLLAAPATTPEPAPHEGGGPFATDTEEIVAGWAKRLPYSDIRQLAHAIDAGRAITVEYVATSGNRTVRTLSRLGLDPPYLEAWCHLRDAERVFTLSRIHSVMSVTPD
ncbi:helicase C-terminal domain-containing protein [Streptomyces sp. WMMC940]|uniref:helicase C-terminal domain-containing protein n=1 Tax=Streptomyces sp. WMMC940 TaxID=3015153 RepID=UPI0022B64F6C|nr:helicase C-terminal domain-containing protein [Streptomyces sp. WMMC940]MCZ7459368.1 helicase C-terminal domain-containing protein [Streptomyces sp. WMMC940]